MGFTDMRINNKTSRQKNKNEYMRDETLQTWQERWFRIMRVQAKRGED